MAPEQRRLAAIVALDVVGYSRLMGRDESGTLAALKAVRREIVDPRLAEAGGRIVKTTGDGLLVEFASVVDAVRSVVEIQRAMVAGNADVPEERRIVFRVGVNLGDIIIDGDDIFGDGVNVAARLQAIGPPGGLCLSGRVHEEVRDRLDLTFEDGGEQPLKNIARPVPVWRWSPAGAPLSPARALADKPSVAVLPLQNLSGDPEQDYFADGITEDLITALSRFNELLVSPRSATFPLKGRPLGPRDVARQLGVQYVLSGSLRKAQNRIRVTAELADAEGARVWSERYDRELVDIFDLQDELSRAVAAVVQPAVRGAEIERARRKHGNLSAYDLYLRALPPMWAGTREEVLKAIALLRQSLAHDGGNAPATAALSWCLFTAPILGAIAAQEAWPESFELGRRAVEIDGTDAFAQAVYSQALSAIASDYAQGAVHAEEAVRLNPSSAVAWSALGYAANMGGDFPRGVEAFSLAIRLSPSDPFLYLWLTALVVAHFSLERYDEALAAARRAVQVNPNYGTGHRLLAACLVHTGRLDEAREVTRKRDAVQKTTVAEIRALGLLRNADAMERYLDAQRQCGVPE